MENEYKDLAKLIKQIQKNIKKYETQNEQLPKGTIFIRKIHNKSFAYRNKRIDGKVISEYLGPVGKDYVDDQLSLSKRYKKNMRMIKELKKDLHQICKSINKKHKDNFKYTNFAIDINKVDGVAPDDDSIAIIRLFEKGVLDFASTEKALMRLSNEKR